MTTNNLPTGDLQDAVSKALRQAYSLGQIYWQQADSEYISQNKKSDVTQARFDALVDETRALLAGQIAMPADADLFWDDDDTESDLQADNEYEAVNNMVENAWKPELPYTFILQRAKRLPSVRITVTAVPEEGEIEYEREEIQSARRRIEGES